MIVRRVLGYGASLLLLAALLGAKAVGAKPTAVVGTLGKIRPPVSVNGRAVVPPRDDGRLLHAGDVVHCGKGGDVTIVIAEYVVHPPCPSDYPIPFVDDRHDPAVRLKEGAVVGVYKFAPSQNCTGGLSRVIAKGGAGDVVNGGFGPVCGCDWDKPDGELCIANNYAAAIWYLRAEPVGAGSPVIELLRPDQQILPTQGWIFNVRTSGGCVFNLRIDFEDGTSSDWKAANLCAKDYETHVWQVSGPGSRAVP